MRRATSSSPRQLPPAPGARSAPRRWGSGPTGSALLTATCAVGAALGLLACASTAPGTSTKTAAEEAPEQARENAGDEAAAATETETRTVEDGVDAAAGEVVSASDDAVVILSGGKRRESDEPTTLAEAAAAAQAQRAASGPPVATITDENRDERAARGELTFVSAPAAGAAPDPSSPGEEETAPAAKPDGEAYWRTTVRDARVRWRDAEQQVEELQARVAELRNAFYAADDPFYREGVVKADWDAALGDLATAKAEVAAARTDLRRLLNAGRRAGALPGWLREGLELEPDPPRQRDAEPSTVEPVEPTSVVSHE